MTYSQLVSELTELIGDPSLSETQIKQFITRAELKIERDLVYPGNVPRQMLTRKDDVQSDSNGRYPIPDDLLKISRVSINGAPSQQTTPDKVYDTSGYAEATVILDYYQKLPTLSDSQTTNWLLDAAYDLYLYGGAMQYEPFAQDGTAPFSARYADAAQTVKNANAPEGLGAQASMKRRPYSSVFAVIGSELIFSSMGTLP